MIFPLLSYLYVIVLFNNGLCDNYTITEGFTRSIYLMVEDRLRDPMSRLEYEWYSSNESVVTVSSYGTVLARQVEIDTTVKITGQQHIVCFHSTHLLNDIYNLAFPLSFALPR